MYSKQYLLYGGAILIIAGIFGFIGVLGPTASQSIFGSAWYFNMGQSWTGIIAGVTAMLLAWGVGIESRRWAAGILGILATLTGLGSLILPVSFSAILGPNPESVLTAIFYLIIGFWGLWSVMTGMESTAGHGMMHPAA